MATASFSQLRLVLTALLPLLLHAATAAHLRADVPAEQLADFDVLVAIQAEVKTVNENLEALSAAIDDNIPVSTTLEPQSTVTDQTTSTTPAPTTKPTAASTTASTKASTTTSTTASTTASTTPSTTASTAASTTPSTTASTTPSTTASTAASTTASTAASTTASTAASTTASTTVSTASTTASPTASTSETSTQHQEPSPNAKEAVLSADDRRQLFISRGLRDLRDREDGSCTDLRDIEETLADVTSALDLVSAKQLSNSTLEDLQTNNTRLNSTTFCVKGGDIKPDNTTVVKEVLKQTQASGQTAADTIDNIVNPTPPPTSPPPEDDSGFKSATIALGVLFALSLVAVAGLAIYAKRQKSG